MTQRKKTYAIPRYYEELGNFLQEMRLRAGLSQREVSEALGYSTAQFISNFERGIAVPPLKKLKLLVKLYNISVEKLMDLILAAERERMMQTLQKVQKKRA